MAGLHKCWSFLLSFVFLLYFCRLIYFVNRYIPTHNILTTYRRYTISKDKPDETSNVCSFIFIILCRKINILKRANRIILWTPKERKKSWEEISRKIEICFHNHSIQIFIQLLKVIPFSLENKLNKQFCCSSVLIRVIFFKFK